MLCLTRKTDYALVALAALAELGESQDTPLSTRRIAERYSLPLPQLMNVFKDLKRADLVQSIRGARGGYALVDGPEKIDLIRVIEVMEGPVRLTMCCDDKTDQDPCVACTQIRQCPVTLGIRKLNELMIAFLSRITLRDLMESNIDVPLSPVRSNNNRVPKHTLALLREGSNHVHS